MGIQDYQDEWEEAVDKLNLKIIEA